MKGGYQIIDLTNIDIVLGSEAVSITDDKVLAELLTLRDYIEDDYDYSKPLNRKLKPILLRLRDEKEGEEIEASLWANLSIIDDNLSFKIEGIINGKTITINAVFEKLQDDDGNDYYAIDEANLLLTNQQPIFENIVDKDGHARFIEGTFTTKDTLTGVTNVYSKWSLCGSHLLIVCCFDVADTTAITTGIILAEITNIPQWILDKIQILDGTTVIPFINFSAIGGATQYQSIRLDKRDTSSLSLVMYALTYNSDKHCRVQFDLLIDNE